ncbi:slipin family protein [Spirochaetota bacterium]
MSFIFSIPAIIIIILILTMIRITREYERAVIFRLGRYHKVKGPGLFLLIPGIDTMERIDLRTLTLDVPTQEVITRDNVPVKVNAVVYFRVMKPDDAVIKVENYIAATSQLAQTTLRNVLGQSELDDLLANRDKISQELQKILDELTDPWGIKVSIVEVKDVELPETMQRAMAKQAEAERVRRAKVIHAKGEYEASSQLAEAAKVLNTERSALQLRFLQTLSDIANEKNSTIVFPVPIDIIETFIKKINK